MFTKIKIIFFFLLGIIYSNCYSQNVNFELRHIKIGNNLAQNEIHSIIQDKIGFIWFATGDGIYKFDGLGFTQYRNDKNNSNSLVNNLVNVLFLDKSGIIWIGTNNGLNSFDPTTGLFRAFKHSPSDSLSISDNSVWAICEDNQNQLWIGTRAGLNRLDKKTFHFRRYFYNADDSNTVSGNDIKAIYRDRMNNLWIGTNGAGLNLYDANHDNFKRFFNDLSADDKISDNIIYSIYEDKENNLWLGTFKNFQKFDRRQKRFKNYDLNNAVFVNSNKKNGIRHKEFLVKSIVEDNLGTIWISSQYGLFKLNKETDKLFNFQIDNDNSLEINHNYIYTIFQDKSGILWLGMYGGGVNQFFTKTKGIEKYSYKNDVNYKLNVKSVRAITEFENNILLVGGYFGLDAVDRKTKRVKRLIDDKAIFTILKDPYQSNIFWIGQDVGGLYRFNIQTGEYEELKYTHPNAVSGEIISSMIIDSKGNFWIGSENGLNKFDGKSYTSNLYNHNPENPFSISDNKINAIYESRNGFLWVGTNAGVNIFDPRTGKFERLIHEQNNSNSLSYDEVLSIFQDKNGYMWFGTNGGGLERFDEESKTFLHFTTKNGMPDNVVYGILDDNDGNLWLSTNNGISKLNISNYAFSNYDEKYGLQNNEYNRNAYFKNKKGELFFGGINGFNSFQPEKIEENKSPPPLVITDFQLGNKSVKVGEKFDGKIILTKPISEIKTIKLSYDQNVFTFEFASLEYFAPRKTKYAYMLEGLDEDWIYIGNRRYATYNSIPPGNYVFKVKAQNNNGVWNNQRVGVSIIIQPPFYKTYWFYVATFLIIVYGIYSLFKFRMNQLLKVERLRVKLASDLHDDIGATLSKISMHAEIIKQGIDPANTASNLTRISELCSYSINTMRDIVWSIDSRNDAMEKMLNKMKDETYKLLQSKNITVKFNIVNLTTQKKISPETRQNLFLILKEAVNNIYKHSNADEVEISLSQTGSRLNLLIRDNGTDADVKKYASGHGLRNMQMRTKQMGGDFSYRFNNGFEILIENVKL